MSEEQPTPSSDNQKRRRRRRPSRKRRRPRQSQGGETSAAAPNRSPADQEKSRKDRRDRRRRRRKPRSRRSSAAHDHGPGITQGNQLDFRLPESIFVYTHVIRSSTLDMYGFRPDPFLTSSRRLEDFYIDLSPLFPDNAADGPIHDSALHGAISLYMPDDEQPGDEMSADDLPEDEPSEDRLPDEDG